MKIIKRIPADDWYSVRDPKHFYAAMRSDVQLLLTHRAYLSLTTIIFCCIDAIAAGSGKATRDKFGSFVARHFPDLLGEIERASPGRKGTEVLYAEFRNGFAHLRAPKPKFAIAEDHELDGQWAGLIETTGGIRVLALNVDRLAREFLTMMEQLDPGAQRSVIP